VTTIEHPTARDFLARHRGGGLFTELVSQRIGAQIAVQAHRHGVKPTILTLGNLGVGLSAAGLIIATDGPTPTIGLCALLLWHLAYALDCADGQLARVTGQASPAGKRIDILCDVGLQVALVAAVSDVAARYEPAPDAWLVAAFAGTWMVNLVTSVLQQGPTAQSLVTRSSLGVRLIKLTRDYGAVMTLIGLVLSFVPQWTISVLYTFTAINGTFLLASVAATARASLRAV
jgi:phosphatidylglycerophosphate synthase